MMTNTPRTIISIFELILIILVISLDFLVPTLVLLAVLAASLLIKKESIARLGFKKPANWMKMAATILIISIGWSLLHLSITMPMLNHLTGTTQNLSAFADLQGNTSKLATLLVVSWVLAALGEEVVYRGYIQKIVTDILGVHTKGILAAVICSSLLFGIAHTEQGTIGIVITLLDALFLSYLRSRFNDNLWAPVLAHGFNNTVGFITFYFVGPIYGFW